MGFYEELSRHYDTVFAVKPEEEKFLRSLVAESRRVLDIGCGTGNKTVLLAGPDREVVGIDLSAGMVEQAKANHAAPGVDYRQCDMMTMDRIFPAGGFDSALCLGNTLVHLIEPGQIEAFLTQVAVVLPPNGLFAAQIINYDRIINAHIDSLPRIETPDVVFTRRYSWEGGSLHFLTDLEVKKTGERFHNDVVLRPIVKDKLVAALTAAGFAVEKLYGGYGGGSYQGDSFHLIAVCRKTPDKGERL